MKLFNSWRPHPGLAPGFYEFTSPLGISGLARIQGDRLELLALVADRPGTGQLSRFLHVARRRYRTIRMIEVWSERLASSLALRGFLPETLTENGEPLRCHTWTRPDTTAPGRHGHFTSDDQAEGARP